MSFLIWEAETDCIDSLTAVNTEYGCPYELRNGYRMDQWAFVSKSHVEENWGFHSPEIRPEKTMDGLMGDLVPGYIENDSMPRDWMAPLEDG